MTLMLLKSTDQIFCSVSLIWGLLVVILVKFRLCILGRNSIEAMPCLSQCITVSGDVGFDHSIKVTSASFLHWKVVIIPFIIKK